MTRRTGLNIPHAELISAVSYDPETGVFRRRYAVNRRFYAGQEIGSLGSGGYTVVWIRGQRLLAHRLAWFYVYGKWPVNTIDHINGDKRDNRILNLRDVLHAENMQNMRKRHKDNKSGFQGVIRKNGRYRAAIGTFGKTKQIGMFDTAQEAHAAYLEAKARLHSFPVIEEQRNA